MFGKKWDDFWVSFEETMSKLPGLVDDAVKSGVAEVTITDGDISIKGRFKSLRINGKTIRLPREVMGG